MVSVGRMNTLEVIKKVNFGVYLDGGDSGEILLPLRYVPESCNTGDRIDVFIYLDSDDRIIATTEIPYAMVGDIAWLKVVSVNQFGAFLDWGLMKQLFVPFREQHEKMVEGNAYFVMIYIDKISNRIAATSRLNKFLGNLPPEYVPGQEVDVMIYEETEIGFKVIINQSDWGMIYKNEVFKPLTIGQKIKSYIKKVREDDKIDLSLLRSGYDKIEGIALLVMHKLYENYGYLPVTDKTSPEVIAQYFEISKRNFKMALGYLYKTGRILIEEYGIRLIDEDGE